MTYHTQQSSLIGKTILLIISGGISAYKSLELIRLIKKSGGNVQCILTKGGAEFITPLSVSALSENPCYTDLFSLKDETEMGHIRLARQTDLIVVAPASANMIAKMTHGMADDLATTTLLASTTPIMVAPAMNPAMWGNPATQDNLKTLSERGINIIAPACGEMACGETGQGRLPEAIDLLNSITDFFSKDKPLMGKHAIVTSGPTYEPIDPVRFIGNRSSGKQGHAIACALRDFGATVTYITGPTNLPMPGGVTCINIETANQMMDAVDNALPADIAICAAAVADYGVTPSPQKQKKTDGKNGLDINFTTNPDILKTLSTHKNRPDIVIGFAAETENLLQNAQQKLLKKQCDAIIANQVGGENNPVFGQDMTAAHWVTKSGDEYLSNLSKADLADIVCQNIVKMMNNNTNVTQLKDNVA